MSTTFDPTTWVEKKRLEKQIEKKSITQGHSVSSLLSGLASPEIGTASIAPLVRPPQALPSPLFEQFESFIQTLILEQLKKPEDLLKLNQSRRESLGRFLSELSGDPEPTDPQ